MGSRKRRRWQASILAMFGSLALVTGGAVIPAGEAAASYPTVSAPVITDTGPTVPFFSLSATSSISGATGVTWTFSFSSPGGMPSGTTIVLANAEGATFSSDSQDFVLSSGGSTVPAALSPATGGGFDLTLDASTPSDTTVTLETFNTTNPSVPAGQTELQDTFTVGVTSPGNATIFTQAALTFEASTAPTSGSSSSSAGSGTLAFDQAPMPPLPAASLPGSDSTSSSFSPYTLRFDNQGDTLNNATLTNSQTLDTQTTTINGNQVLTTISGNTYYLTDAAAVEIPVNCASEAGNTGWVTACNVKVEDQNGNPWPDLQVVNAQGGTVSMTLNTSNGGLTFTMPQVAVNTTADPVTSPVVDPQSAVPTQLGQLFAPNYINSSANAGPVDAPGGLTLIPMPDCPGGTGTASATLLIPLNGVSAQVKIVTTEISVNLQNFEHDLGAEVFEEEGLVGLDGFGQLWGSSACSFEGYVGMFLLSTHTSAWAYTLNSGLEGSDVSDVTTSVAAPGGGNPPYNYIDAFVGYNDSRVINLAQLPAAEIQLNVMPYKILYQPPGDNSHSEFTLSQSATSQTDFTIGQESTVTTATSNQIGWNAGLSAEDVGSVSYEGTWDQSTSQANTNGTTNGRSESWTSAEDQQWQSYSSANNNGLPQLDTPGTEPWLYDEMVLEVHPQFAIYDGAWCPDGGTDCGTNASGQTEATPAQGTTFWTLLGARPTQFDVRVGDLLACAEGTAIPIPNTNPTETLSPAECLGLLRLDPFAAAGTQSLDPSSTTAAGAIGSLAIPVESYAAGMPGEGTNGAYAVELSQSQETSNSSETTSSFTSTVDASLTNKVDVQADVGIPLINVQAGISYEQSISTGQSLSISYTQSQTSSQVTQEAASATLSDLLNPIETNIFLDTRWDTLMFQVPAPQVTGMTPNEGLGVGSLLQLTGQDFYGGPVEAQFCPAGSSAPCIPAAAVSVSSDTVMTVTAPSLSPGSYCVQVIDAGGPSTCSAGSQFTVLTPQQQAAENGVTAPIVSSVSPASGPDGGGTAVTLTGANLGDVQQVWFGTSDPAANPGLYNQYLAAGAPGSLPTLAKAPFTILNDGEIVACAPPVAAPETVWVSVYGPAGWSDVTPADQFTYTGGSGTPCTPAAPQGAVGPPTVTSVSPASGPVTGGTMVTVSGSGFQDLQQSVACTVYGCPAGSDTTLLLPPAVQFCVAQAAICSQATDVQVLNDSTLQIQAPPSETGTGTVDVEVMGPGGWSSPNPGDQFTYTPGGGTCGSSTGVPCGAAGSLTLGATPTAAAAGLGSVQLSATVLDGNDNPLPDTPVVFGATGGELSVNQAVYTDSGGVATVSLTSQEPGTVSVTAAVYGNPGLVNRTSVTFEPVPIVTGLSTSSGPISGGTELTIYGFGFSGATTVSFGGTAVTSFTVAPDGTSITLTTPPGLGTVDVQVANGAARSGTVAADQFTYSGISSSAPEVTSVTPPSGPSAGGTVVDISGSGFTGASQVLFGSAPATTFDVLSDSEIQATSPAGNGTVNVTVISPNGPSTPTSGDTFTYVAPLGPVVRTLAAGWNTLSAPFPLAGDGSLSGVLSDGGSSVVVALTWDCATSQEAASGDCWQQVTGSLPAPMQGLFVELRSGTNPVTATFTPATGINPPPELTLQEGWNLVGPSSLITPQSDQAFLAGVPSASVPLLVDPNGSALAITDPATDVHHMVQDGYAYWLFSESPGLNLPGQVPTGSINP